ncbi:inactive serine protease PAMR1 [Sphaeramia orbicularis]|uniref:inactive serine protease PAMR1 n=1 Tax=Sphaeramia orbicularis TaxID=375764 RepID=UPI00117D1516|nr:inactive serine protease PAMR1-like [Sphaeramia orbicularis]
MLIFLTRQTFVPALLDCRIHYLLLVTCLCVESWPYVPPADDCPSSRWSVMCRPCCEYQLIQCRCPSKGSKVGYTVPCCRNALDQCDPCIIHPGCSLFENCKSCHNGTWRANDDFFVNGKYCTECRQGWSGGDCKTCGAVLQRAQGHIALESYPTNARCEWRLHAERGNTMELRFSLLSVEPDHSCRYDYIEVRDGEDLSSPVIGRFCGDQIPPPIKSSGNNLHILFTSDGYNNFDGFVLTFQESSVSPVRKPACAPPEQPVNGHVVRVYEPKGELFSVEYQCHPPFTLMGSQQQTCLPNGTWSGTAPTCVKGQTSRLRCSPPSKLHNGFYRPVTETTGSAEEVEFFCKNSYILSGNHRSTCLSNGSWSSRPPKCVRACREPKVSELVQQSVVRPNLQSRMSLVQRLGLSSRFNMQDLLSVGFVPLRPDGPFGNDDSAPDDLPRGLYPVHTSIDYKCASPLYRHTGSSRRTCMKNGRWSGRHFSCSPVCGKLDSFSTSNMTDTQWPWHAAIYIRLAPDGAAGSHRPRDTSTSDQQEASEESTFWKLACSGALLSQRSVLVAAQCVADRKRRQPLQPAHVKMVVGAQAVKKPMKSLHHLRVSDVLIHPSFRSSPDFNVAVLKLKDKARISERVLPLCLPQTPSAEVTAQEAYTARWVLPDDHKQLNRHLPQSRTRLEELADVGQCEREFAQTGAHSTAISDNSLCVIRNTSSPQSPCLRVIPGITAIPVSSHGDTGGADGVGWQLLGLESFSSEEKDCRLHTHTLHTKISKFRDWIEANMK